MTTHFASPERAQPLAWYATAAAEKCMDAGENNGALPRMGRMAFA
jgi:hypothetical protein